MAMTLLAMAQAVSDEISFARPTSLFSNPDTTSRQMLALANREGNEQSSDGQWPQLRREYTFPTVASTDNYAMPSDFSRMIGATQWDRGTKWPMNGPLTAQEWQTIKSGFGQLGPRSRFRLMQSRFYIDPVPSSVTTIAYEYEATGWCQAPSGGVYQSAWATDADVFALDEQCFILGMKWRLLRAKGQDYGEEQSDWSSALARAYSRAAGTRTLSMNPRQSPSFLLTDRNVPDTGYGV